MKVFSRNRCHLTWLLLTVLVLGTVLTDDRQGYSGYQVLSVTPRSEDDLKILEKLWHKPGIDFWKLTSSLGEDNVVSVSPKELENVLATLKYANITTDILIDDLQKSNERELEEQRRASEMKDDRLSYDRYLPYDEIVRFARDLEQSHSDLVKTEVIGRSVEGREMIAVLVSRSSGKRNRGIFVDAGIHAREWIAPATAVFVLDQLVNNSTASNELLTDLDWYIVPVVNPDGYDFTFRNAQTRLWRKNRKPSASGGCIGVDVNRNFDYQWNVIGASQDPCSEIYSGPQEFSELEARALRDYILNQRPKLKMYLTLHSYGSYILHPWGFTSSLPADAKELKFIGDEANKAMVKAGSKPYKVGSSAVVLYPAAGASDDWAKARAGIEKSYTIELPGGGKYGFDMPPYQIKNTVRTVFEGLRIFAKYTKLLN